ncbi:MAG: LytR C-terminal domain-containing protein [Candidatus Stahlbacteria bacterium]|nr:LytR C-terminal domain-containing protein [Candidatus Stahlbacteria bacterium]
MIFRKRQKTEDRKQRTENRGQKTETTVQDGKKNRLLTIVIFLIGVLCIGYLISIGRNFILSRLELKQIEVSKVRVEVLNGTNIKGLAETASEILRKKGFDVVRYGNAEDTVLSTIIIDRSDPELKNAKVVQSILKQGLLTFESHALQLFEVTVVLGTDFKVKKEASILETK